MLKAGFHFVVCSVFFVSMGACSSATSEGSSEGSDENSAETNSEETLTSVTQTTNWYAQPDFGGLYAAQEKGYYEEAGLDMTIQSGGPQTSEIQIVASGEADYGMATADEIIAARQEGVDIVAISALYQINPQVLLYHENQQIEDFDDLNGRTVYVAPGVMYWEYLKENYDLENVEEQAFQGQFTAFMNDETSVSQAYFTTAPYNLSQQGVETDYLLINDSGYETYANVLFTTRDKIEENPEEVEAFVHASTEGWNYYRDNYEEINDVIHDVNSNLDREGMTYSSEQLMELVFGYGAEENGVGHMTEERWQQLADQLYNVGVLEEEVNANDVFTTEFLPE